MEDLLFLVHRLPYPPNKGDKIRSWNILRHLAGWYRVHLACFVDSPDDRRYIPKVEAVCASSCIVPISPRWSRLRSLTALAGSEALSLRYYRNARISGWIDETLRKHRPAKAFVYCSAMATYLMEGEAARLRRVVDMVDVDSDKWKQYAEKKASPERWIYRREADTLLRFERSAAASFDATVFVSEKEAELFRRLAPESAARVHGISNGVDTAFFDPSHALASPFPAGQKAVVFTGAMDYWPNADAVSWFVEQVLPLAKSAPGDVKFYIVGSNPSTQVRALAADPRVVVTGRVDDIRPFMAHAAAIVAPLRVARGIQNKVLEGLAMARPLVASPAALEGIDAEPGRHLLLADDAPSFAKALDSLLADAAASRMGELARRHMVEHYSWDANLARFDRLLEGDVVGEAPAHRPAGVPRAAVA